jgi:pilus assembly protein CpaB
MRGVFALVLLVGVGLAGFAVYMAQNYIDGYQQALAKERKANRPAIQIVEVAIAKTPMKYGEKLDPENVVLVAWPKQSMPEGVFTTTEALFPNDNKDARFVLRPMEPGEPIMAIKVTNPGEDAGLTTRLSKGMRAFAIKVDVASGVSGFLRPGDRVDVYWTGTVQNGDGFGRDFTKLIQAGVDLIAIDQSADMETIEGSIARTVTVAVRPEQVAALAQAQNSGSLSLSLVGASDDTLAQAIEVDQSALLGIEAEAQIAEVRNEVCTIKTRRGADVVEIPIPCSD